MKPRNTYFYICNATKILTFGILCCFAPILSAKKESTHPLKVESAITQSPFERKEWIKLLDEYKKKDTEKYEAACFLIANMPLHRQDYVVEKIDTAMLHWLKAADEQYYNLVSQRNDTALFNPNFNEKVLAKADQQYRKATEAKRFCQPQLKFGDFNDVTQLSPIFIRQHIEHAFAARRRNPFAKCLKFQDFLYYILPYRAMEHTPAELSSTYSNIYEKYLHADTARSIHNVIWRYNLTAKRLRYWGGTYPFKQPVGACEMGFLDSENCANKVDRAVQILRACGIPAAVEYNIAYKMWEGRHYHVAIPTPKGWETFNPEGSLPEYRNKGFQATLNVYRIQFSQQPDAPFALRNKEEPIPESLSSPFIVDVTQNMAQTIKLTLPFEEETSHRLAYLATFRASDYGLFPVTWGIIDSKTKTTTFEHVVPNHLYFPVFLDEEGETQSFADPFYIKSIDSKQGYVLESYRPSKQQIITGQIERTFPRKPEMVKAAQRAVGTYVIASDDKKFAQADTIGRILTAANTYWEDLPLATKRPYRYYRVCGSRMYPKVYLSEIAFLSDRDTSRYVTNAPYNEQLSPEENARWKQLWDEPVEKSTWKAEYDGRPQTAPDHWPDVTLELESPKIVNRLRYMGKHAGNTIEKGQSYELLTWSNGFWKKVGLYVAKQSKLKIPKLCEGQLYWLKKRNGQQESLPFILNKDGRQHFPQEEK